MSSAESVFPPVSEISEKRKWEKVIPPVSERSEKRKRKEVFSPVSEKSEKSKRKRGVRVADVCYKLVEVEWVPDKWSHSVAFLHYLEVYNPMLKTSCWRILKNKPKTGTAKGLTLMQVPDWQAKIMATMNNTLICKPHYITFNILED